MLVCSVFFFISSYFSCWAFPAISFVVLGIVSMVYHHVRNFHYHSRKCEHEADLSRSKSGPFSSCSASAGEREKLSACKLSSPSTGSHGVSLLHEHLIHLAFIQAQKPELSAQVLVLLKE